MWTPSAQASAPAPWAAAAMRAGVGDRPDRVRRQREGDHPRALADQLLEGIDVERHVLDPQRGGAHDEVVVGGDHEPG